MRNVQTDWRVMGFQLALTVVIGISAGFSLAYTLLTATTPLRDTFSPNTMQMLKHNSVEPTHEHGDRSIAEALAKKVRVLCWVLTCPGNHYTKAIHVRTTWGKRCNILIFMSTENDKSLPAIKLPVGEGRNHLWGKTKAAFQYVYKYHRSDADWFMKADDDTYVIVENLRYMLADYNSTDPQYFGDLYRSYESKGYMHGGAGYVLSREALDRFVTKGLPSPHLCRSDEGGFEDVEIGKCLYNVGVKAIDTRDSRKQGRFFKDIPEFHWRAELSYTYWHWKVHNYETNEGHYCCSETAITFHYLKPWQMHEIEYILYHLRPYGITQKSDHLQKLLITAA